MPSQKEMEKVFENILNGAATKIVEEEDSNCCGASCDCETREIDVPSEVGSDFEVEIRKVRPK